MKLKYLYVLGVFFCLAACAKKPDITMEEKRLNAENELAKHKITEEQETARVYAEMLKTKQEETVTETSSKICPVENSVSSSSNDTSEDRFTNEALMTLLKRQDDLETKMKVSQPDNGGNTKVPPVIAPGAGQVIVIGK